MNYRWISCHAQASKDSNERTHTQIREGKLKFIIRQKNVQLIQESNDEPQLKNCAVYKTKEISKFIYYTAKWQKCLSRKCNF